MAGTSRKHKALVANALRSKICTYDKLELESLIIYQDPTLKDLLMWVYGEDMILYTLGARYTDFFQT
jgi:hypothetical protein